MNDGKAPSAKKRKPAWSIDEEARLIELYRPISLLWDEQHPDYNNRVERKCALSIIADQMGEQFDVVMLEDKIRELRDNFVEEEKEESRWRDSFPSYVSGWEHFRSLQFLRPSTGSSTGYDVPNLREGKSGNVTNMGAGQTSDWCRDTGPPAAPSADACPPTAGEALRAAGMPDLSQLGPQAFQRPDQLPEPLAGHLGTRLHKCPACPEQFARLGERRTHIRSKHAGEKAYKCGVCTAAFEDQRGLTRHLKRHAGGYLYECPLCGERFRVRFDLSKHLRDKHVPGAKK